MSRIVSADGGNSLLTVLCKAQNLLGNSNDLTVAGGGAGQWDYKAGFTSVAKNQPGPDGTPNTANRLVGGAANALYARQSLSGTALSESDFMTISMWARRESGTHGLRFDIGDGTDPSTRTYNPPTEQDWYWFWLTCEAGTASWLDINFVSGGADTTWDIHNMQINQGTIPFLYSDTLTNAFKPLAFETRTIKQTDLWRIGTEVK